MRPRWANEKSRPGSPHLLGKKCLLVSLSVPSVIYSSDRPSDTAFTCLFCHHDKSVTVRLDRKEGVAYLACRVCDQRYQSKVNREFSNISLARDGLKFVDLTEPIDIYSEWIDAADAAQSAQAPRRPVTSSSRPIPAPASGEEDSDDE